MLRRLAFLASFLLLTVVAAQAQTVLTADQLQNGQAVELDKLGWKYAPGDDPRFADLVRTGDAWAEGRAQDDDMTFVVLKVKANDSESLKEL